MAGSVTYWHGEHPSNGGWLSSVVVSDTTWAKIEAAISRALTDAEKYGSEAIVLVRSNDGSAVAEVKMKTARGIADLLAEHRQLHDMLEGKKINKDIKDALAAFQKIPDPEAEPAYENADTPIRGRIEKSLTQIGRPGLDPPLSRAKSIKKAACLALEDARRKEPLTRQDIKRTLASFQNLADREAERAYWDSDCASHAEIDLALFELGGADWLSVQPDGARIKLAACHALDAFNQRKPKSGRPGKASYRIGFLLAARAWWERLDCGEATAWVFPDGRGSPYVEFVAVLLELVEDRKRPLDRSGVKAMLAKKT